MIANYDGEELARHHIEGKVTALAELKSVRDLVSKMNQPDMSRRMEKVYDHYRSETLDFFKARGMTEKDLDEHLEKAGNKLKQEKPSRQNLA